MAQRRRPEAELRGDQPVGAQVVGRGRVEVDEPLLPQLHHRDRGEGLGDGGDPEDGVLGDRCVRRDVRDTVSVEEVEGSIAHHAHRQTNGRTTVEDPIDSGPHLVLINLGHGSPFHRPGRTAPAPATDIAPISVTK